MKRFFSLMVMVLFLTAGQAQTDPVLFTVENTPVHVSEFKYIYSKTNQDKADFSQQSLEEYLDLYTKFKLKVQRAKDLHYDTISSLKKELEGYNRQLADSYLIDREVTDRLIREVYDRMKKDLNVSHIMISCAKNASPEDTLKAYQKIMATYENLQKGSKWNDVCSTASEDKMTKDNGGSLGYFTAMLPDGFYDFETAMYALHKGEYSRPLRSPVGYHIIRVDDTRDARGEMEVAHILIRDAKDKPNPGAKATIDSIYTALKGGANFDDLAKSLSEDNMTKPKGGYLGFFGINRYEKTFEDAAFALAADGNYTAPLQTTAGWHIVKRVSKKGMEPFETSKNKLKSRVQRDGRYEIAKQSMINRIKSENGFTETTATLDQFINTLDSNFLTYKWKAPEEKSTVVLMKLGGGNYTLGDFTDYLGQNARRRMDFGTQRMPVADATRYLYKEFIGEKCLRFEEKQLNTKYPEFRALMREYEEGVLLFEATKNLVWDKASQDTVGLEKYFESYKQKYQWDDRAVVSIYTLADTFKSEINDLRALAAKKPANEVLEKFNKKSEKATVREEVYEKGRNKVVDALDWKPGSLSAVETSKKDNSLNFMKIEKILPRSQKELKDSRGYVVADYQDYLEKQWVEELRKMYKVTVNKEVLQSLIQKP